MSQLLLLLFAVYSITAPLLNAQSGAYYTIQTVAGSYNIGDGGPASSSLIFGPLGVAFDSAGNTYIADTRNSAVRKVTPQGTITTLANRVFPIDIAVDSTGQVYVLNGFIYGSQVLRISSTGIVTIYAGAGNTFSVGGDNGPARSATFGGAAIALDSSNNLYIADAFNDRVRKITASTGVITTIAGTGVYNSTGDGGPATAATIANPRGIAVDRAGNIYVSDRDASYVRRITPDGIINPFAGRRLSYATTGDGGPATGASLLYPARLAVDSAGNLYIGSDEYKIRRVGANGIITTVLGTGTYGFSGDGGPAIEATIASQVDDICIALDRNGLLNICDTDNDRIRRVDSAGNINTIIGTSHYGGDGGPATSAILKFPVGVTVLNGITYITDTENHRIRTVSPQGVINTIMGALPTFADGPLSTARTRYPRGLVSDSGGNLYFPDLSHRVRRINAAGIVSTFGGSGTQGFNGDFGPATAARMNTPYGIAMDADGNIYFADTSNQRVRKIAVDGTISTVAGNGTSGFAGDGGQAAMARLSGPRGVAVDRQGNLYIGDSGNHRVRKVDINGIITTFAGTGVSGTTGDNGPATAARLNTPYGVAADGSNSIFIAEWNGNVIRRVTTNGVITTIAGDGSFAFGGDGGIATVAQLNGPASMHIDGGGVITFTDQYNHRVRRLTPLFASSLTAAQGDKQSALVNTVLPTPLGAKVVTSGGVGVPGMTVNFSVVSGSARLSTDTAVTGLDGIATVQVTLGDAAGEISIRAIASGLQALLFTATARTAAPPPGPPAPKIISGTVQSGGQSTPPLTMLAVNSQAFAEGENFAAAADSKTLLPAEIAGKLPLVLGKTCVTVGGVAAPIFSVTPSRVGFVIPDTGATGDLPLQVTANCGAAGAERMSNVEVVTVQGFSPEFYYAGPAKDGKRPVLMTGSGKPGSNAAFVLTGLGATVPPITPGDQAPPDAVLAETITITIGDRDLPGDAIVSAVASMTNPGTYDVTIVIPADLATGDYPIVLQIGGVPTPAGAVLQVRTGEAAAVEHDAPLRRVRL